MIFDWSKCRSDLAWLKSNTILLTLTGSHAYGLATESSDYDWRGVCIPPKEYFTGFLKRFEQADKFDGVDCSIFGIHKFFELAANANPNILEILWSDASDEDSFWGAVLRSTRGHFLSRKVKHTFSGYAIAQLKRIKTHRRWLLNPPDHKPVRSEFDLPETTVLSADIIGAIEAVEKADAEANLLDRFGGLIMHAYQRERAYHNALTQWQQYENWKRTRNPARAEIEAKHGYDCKHAMHLVRLMRMGAEILGRGEVVVKRPDRVELLAIRAGAWSYDRLVGYAEEMDAKLGELEKISSLPHSPDRELLDAYCREMVEGFHRWRR